ncbi:MAG: hypothetical protein JSS27_18805 [Planctomycetes bacterium]|nr:hypothetical protein [Planctomycetota bacterium]
MLRWMFNLVYESIPVAIQSDYSLDESVSRLRTATRPWTPFSFMDSGAIGVVNENRVSLQRMVSFVNNGFKYHFYGKFLTRDDNRVVLKGRFTMSLFVKVFLTIWFGGVLLGTTGGFIAGITALSSGDRSGLAFLIGCPLFVAFACAFIHICKACSRGDIPWLTDLMTDTLTCRPGRVEIP